MAIGPSVSNTFPAVMSSFSGRIPAGGAKVVPYVLNFTDTTPQYIDLTLQQQGMYIDIVQSVFIDASGADNTVQIFCPGTRQYIDVAGRSQGYYPLLTPAKSLKFEVSMPLGVTSNGLVTIIFMNMPIPAGQWLNNLLGTMDNLSGAIKVFPGEPTKNLTDYSGTTTATASTVLFPAVSTRVMAQIVAPVANDLWINPHGGAASVGGIGCFRIPAGTIWESPLGYSCIASFHYYCAAAANYACYTVE